MTDMTPVPNDVLEEAAKVTRANGYPEIARVIEALLPKPAHDPALIDAVDDALSQAHLLHAEPGIHGLSAARRHAYTIAAIDAVRAWDAEYTPAEASVPDDDREAELAKRLGQAWFSIQTGFGAIAATQRIAKARAAGVVIRLPLTDEDIRVAWKSTPDSLNTYGVIHNVARLWGLLPPEEEA